MAMDPKKPRKGKPLLLATVGLATVSFIACEPGSSRPVGNLRAPDPDPMEQPDAAAPDEPTDPDAGAPDAGQQAINPQPLEPRPSPPVGNLRPPPGNR
jgi:hypothetical protein